MHSDSDDLKCCRKVKYEDYYSDLEHNSLKFCRNCQTLLGNCSVCHTDSRFEILFLITPIQFINFNDVS